MSGSLAVRFARRELRGSLKSFRIFLACLALGVTAIAGVGSVAASLLDGVSRDARLLLGGDVEFRTTHTLLPDDVQAHLRNSGKVARTTEMRAMARKPGGDRRVMVELKGVDGAYPLFGALLLQDGVPFDGALEARDGVYGAVVDPTLAGRLGLSVGDRVSVGEGSFEVRGFIATEPDRAVGFASFGPRLMVSDAGLGTTDLVQVGSMIRFHEKLALAEGTSAGDWITEFRDTFGEGPWRLRATDRAAPGLDRFIQQVTQFMTLVGLTALLVGGVGVANAVRSFLDQRLATIATLKCLGAPADLVFWTYLLQILVLATVGIGIGLVLGAVAPMIAATVLEDLFPFEVPVALHWEPLLTAAVFGYLTTLTFAVWPLARARDVRAVQLFRALIVPPGGWPAKRYIVLTAVATLLLAALSVTVTEDRRIAIGFVLGALAAVLLFGVAARAVIALARRVPVPKVAGLRLALANIHRPGSATSTVIPSFGLGLTVLVAVALIEANLARQINDQIPDRAPDYFFIDIQPHQAEEFETLVAAIPDVVKTEQTPMVRGRIIALNGTPIHEVTVDESVEWAVNGDRGLTYSAEMPPSTNLVEGEWWPADYAGPPLISFDSNIARGFGIGIGDKVTLNVLGREIEATIGNLRKIDWATLGINFVIVFAPGTLEAAPHSVLATVYTDTAKAEAAVLSEVTDRFANVSAIRVKDALDAADRILSSVGIAIRVIASITLVAGVLVLAGALMAGHQRRVYDAVVLKVLGATRVRVLSVYLMEYGLLGLAAAAIAGVIGAAAAMGVVVQVMRSDFVLDTTVLVTTTLLSMAITMILGLIGTWQALGRKAAPLLRTD